MAAGPVGRTHADLGARFPHVLQPGGPDFDAQSARVWRVLTTLERTQARAWPL